MYILQTYHKKLYLSLLVPILIEIEWQITKVIKLIY
jgi:hypothetical protein